VRFDSESRGGAWELRLWAGDAAATATVTTGNALADLVARAQATAAREATGAVTFRALAGESVQIQVSGAMGRARTDANLAARDFPRNRDA
jgi:hypothetical protein